MGRGVKSDIGIPLDRFGCAGTWTRFCPSSSSRLASVVRIHQGKRTACLGPSEDRITLAYLVREWGQSTEIPWLKDMGLLWLVSRFRLVFALELGSFLESV